MPSKSAGRTTKHCVYSTCNSDSRYSHLPYMEGVFFLSFPEPRTRPEKCDLWIRALGRTEFNRENVKRRTYICSKHFIGGKGPTKGHPDPIPAQPAVKLKKTHKRKTNRLQKHFPGGKPTDRISDPVPAAPTTSKTYKSARRTRARHPRSERLASKRRKTLKDIVSAYTRHKRADHHSNTSVQPGYGHQNKDAFTVLRLYKRSPLDFGADVKTSSPRAVQKMYVQKLWVIEVELSNQDNWSPNLDQKPPQIKGKQEDADITEFTVSPVPVKSEDDEEKPQPSVLLHKQRSQIKEEQEEADITEFIFNAVPVKDDDEEEKPQFSELHHDWNDKSTDSVRSSPDRYLKSDPEDKHSESSETDVSDGNWEESSAAQPDHFPASGVRHDSPQRPPSDENPFSCSVCVQCFRYGTILHNHDDTHTGDKPFRCNICKAAFGQKLFFVRHMKIHTGETLFSFYE
ncbi:zinc finger and SCAN domain-containing protein 5A [Nematolebias whitei]|uniref:zinc finger and SCAN domain-containing protein 5A n=1 Tax=Nematolebias whitei TaxID=451745 RepID=UPI00189742AE|nr:zinc finger and SCAN domain-containing protein 5A [Nematolebias whitei]